jgi:hypothetical protein
LVSSTREHPDLTLVLCAFALHMYTHRPVGRDRMAMAGMGGPVTLFGVMPQSWHRSMVTLLSGEGWPMSAGK